MLQNATKLLCVLIRITSSAFTMDFNHNHGNIARVHACLSEYLLITVSSLILTHSSIEITLLINS